MKILMLWFLLVVVTAMAVTPPNIVTDDNAPVEWTTEDNSEDITTEHNEVTSSRFDSLITDDSTEVDTPESTSLFESVTPTDSPELDSFTETSLLNIRINESDGFQLEVSTERDIQNKGIGAIQISDLDRSAKMMNNFNDSESNTRGTVLSSGAVVNGSGLSKNSPNKGDLYPVTAIAAENNALLFVENTGQDIKRNKKFQVMDEDIKMNPIHCTTFQESNDTTPGKYVPFQAEGFLRDTLTGLKLNKCFCPPYHLLNESSNGQCVSTQTSFIEVLTDPINSANCNLPESNFRQIEVVNLTCPHPLRLHQMDFKFLLTGEAQHTHYDTRIKSSQFCMENIEFSDGHREWNIMACLEPPRIPKCCGSNQYFDVAAMGCVSAKTFSGGQLNGSSDLIGRFTIPTEENLAYLTLSAEPQVSVGPPTCSGGRKHFALQVTNASKNSVSLVNNLHDVRLYVSHSEFNVFKYFQNSEYCVDWSNEPSGEVDYVAVFCYEDPFKIHHSQCSLSRNCIRKCCPGDEILDMISLNCTPPHDRQYLYKPSFYKRSWAESTDPVLRNTSYEVVHGLPLCSFINAKHKENFYLLDDGSAYFHKDNRRFTSEYYCVDAQQGYLNQTDTVIYYCDEAGIPYGNTCWRLRLVLYPVLQVVSCVFLLVTLLVYQLLPELQRLTISGRSLPSHVLALFIASCSMLAIYIGRLSENYTGLCIALAFVIQFSLLATFFWLNVMCFEMWYRIRIQQTLAVSRAESRQKYMLYSLYGWGLPGLITLLTGVVQAVAPSSSLTPNYGDPYCWFKPNEPAYWIYFSVFVILLCLANIYFFVDLAHITVRQCLNSTLIHHSTQQHMGRILLCLKLFMVMGVTWIFEEISFHDDACSRWFVTDIINLLRGPFVFLSVVSTRSVSVKLKNKVLSLFNCVGGGGRPLFVPPTSRGWAVANPRRKAASLRLDSVRRYPTCRIPSESGSRDSLASVKTEETSIGQKSDTSINPKADDSSSVYQRESSVLTQESECSSGLESSEGQPQLDPTVQDTCPSTQESYSSTEEQHHAAQEKYPSPQESYPSPEDQHPSAQEKYSSPQESYPSPEDQHPSAQEKYPSPEDQHPSPEDQHPSPEDQHPSAQEKYPSLQESYPSPKDQHPSAQEKYPSPQESYPSPEDQHPSAQEKYPSPQESYPSPEDHLLSAQEKSPATQEQHPASHDQHREPHEVYESSRQQDENKQTPELVGGSHGEVERSPSHDGKQEEIMPVGDENLCQSQEVVEKSQDESEDQSSNSPVSVSPPPSQSAESCERHEGGDDDGKENDAVDPHHGNKPAVVDDKVSSSSRSDTGTVGELVQKESSIDASYHNRQDEV